MSPNELTVAENFITAFYSFDAARLTGLMTQDADAGRVLYYQRWAEAANYQVKTRQPCRLEGSEIVCAIKVTDDFGKTLGYEATDTFRIGVAADKVSSVSFSGDDPPIFNDLFTWIAAERPEILSGPCKAMFNGGTTPGECAHAVAGAAKQFVSQQK